MPRTDIKLLALDVDGVMTDGGMYYGETAEEIKRFDTKDGRGIIELQKRGVAVGLLSSGFSAAAIEKRAAILGIKRVYVGADPKAGILLAWCKELGIEPVQAAYIGDDINDRDVIRIVGLSACPADAVKSIKALVDIVLTRPGGHGAVREFIEEHLGHEL